MGGGLDGSVCLAMSEAGGEVWCWGLLGLGNLPSSLHHQQHLSCSGQACIIAGGKSLDGGWPQGAGEREVITGWRGKGRQAGGARGWAGRLAGEGPALIRLPTRQAPRRRRRLRACALGDHEG